MSEFSISEFHWNPKRFHANERDIVEAVEALNALTTEQVKAVRLYGRSCYEDGYDEGNDPTY